MANKLNIEDYRGKKYGRLTILDFYIKSRATYAICKCDCGNIHHARMQHIKGGKIKSCGCYNIELCKNHSKKTYTHFKSSIKIYKTWSHIKKRCLNKKAYAYKNYGGRGIKVCQEWQNDFMNFYNWAIANGYDENAEHGECTIDRIDVNGDYCPNNCRWIDMKTQQRNKRNNRFITYKGETHCISEWGEMLGISRSLLYYRINQGWSIEKALNTPIRKHKKAHK